MATSDVGSDKGPEPGDVAQSRGIWTEAMMEMNDDVYQIDHSNSHANRIIPSSKTVAS